MLSLFFLYNTQLSINFFYQFLFTIIVSNVKDGPKFPFNLLIYYIYFMKKLTLLAAVIFSLSSCVVYESHTVTGNPIGTKKGVSRVGAFSKDKDFTMATTAKKAKIEKIGSVDTKLTICVFPFYKTIVTGE